MTKMIEVHATEANNYSRILTLLGMEEEGDPVEGVADLMKWRQTAESFVKESMGLRVQLAERDSELHEAIAKLRDTDTRWPSHGSAPLAIAAGYALLQKDRNDLHERVAELEKLAEVNASIERHLKDQCDKLQDQSVHWEMTCGNLTAGLKRKDALLRGCIGIMNSGPYVDAVLVRGAVEAINKELTP